MICKFGFCSVCEKEISKKCDTCDHRQQTQDYTEVEMQWSNGAKMKVGVCMDCANSHAWTTPQAKEGITKAHWDYWDKGNCTYDKEIVIA